MPDPELGVFVIDGDECPFPLLHEGFTLDEAMAFFGYTGFPIEDLLVDEDELDGDELDDLKMRTRSPKTLAGLMHIAYTRKHPEAKESAVRKIVGAADFVTSLAKFAETKADAGPPAEPQSSEHPTSSSDERHDESSERSGDDSTTSSDQQGDSPAPTGTTGSVTSLTSLPTRLAS